MFEYNDGDGLWCLMMLVMDARGRSMMVVVKDALTDGYGWRLMMVNDGHWRGSWWLLMLKDGRWPLMIGGDGQCCFLMIDDGRWRLHDLTIVNDA